MLRQLCFVICLIALLVLMVCNYYSSAQLEQLMADRLDEQTLTVVMLVDATPEQVLQVESELLAQAGIFEVVQVDRDYLQEVLETDEEWDKISELLPPIFQVKFSLAQLEYGGVEWLTPIIGTWPMVEPVNWAADEVEKDWLELAVLQEQRNHNRGCRLLALAMILGLCLCFWIRHKRTV